MPSYKKTKLLPRNAAVIHKPAGKRRVKTEITVARVRKKKPTYAAQRKRKT